MRRLIGHHSYRIYLSPRLTHTITIHAIPSRIANLHSHFLVVLVRALPGTQHSRGASEIPSTTRDVHIESRGLPQPDQSGMDSADPDCVIALAMHFRLAGLVVDEFGNVEEGDQLTAEYLHSLRRSPPLLQHFRVYATEVFTDFSLRQKRRLRRPHQLPATGPYAIPSLRRRMFVCRGMVADSDGRLAPCNRSFRYNRTYLAHVNDEHVHDTR